MVYAKTIWNSSKGIHADRTPNRYSDHWNPGRYCDSDLSKMWDVREVPFEASLNQPREGHGVSPLQVKCHPRQIQITRRAMLLSDPLKQLVAQEDSWPAARKSLTRQPRKLEL